MPINIYFVHLVNFIDLRTAFSTFPEKIKAAKNMIGKFNLES